MKSALVTLGVWGSWVRIPPSRPIESMAYHVNGRLFLCL
ncbi:hypothetical protein BMETH_667_1 [methanotrophic bacterial endosymbiont of Bathymodiolus sp.]|nr:hypothetical protein BMETH_667_1 [methanotrophic bacterial endosymbiont of Bathymodiolus sp.]